MFEKIAVILVALKIANLSEVSFGMLMLILFLSIIEKNINRRDNENK